MDWDPWFDRGKPWFSPLARALEPFRRCARFPTLDEWNAAFPPLTSRGGAPIRFVLQPPKRRGRVDQAAIDLIYDERIFVRGEVPSRPSNWHDFFNMLVWVTLPKTKVAINARQRTALRARVSPGMAHLPSARSREQDLLAIFDEGGAIERPDGSFVIVGHAIYEHFACTPRPVHAYLHRVSTTDLDDIDTEVAAFLDSGAELPADGPSITLTP